MFSILLVVILIFLFHKPIKGFTILLLLFSCSEHPKCAGQHLVLLGIDPSMMEVVVFRISGNRRLLCECVMDWSAPAEPSVFSVHSLNHQSIREVQIRSSYLCITDGAQSKKNN